MTNVGMVLPDEGYHKALREITRRTGTLLVIDETHTMSSGPGGYTREHGLEPDAFVMGKPIAAAFPQPSTASRPNWEAASASFWKRARRAIPASAPRYRVRRSSSR